MGDGPGHARGWLGQPTSRPTRVDLGKWKRSFTGGTVYANLTGETWKDGRASVPARDAQFVKS